MTGHRITVDTLLWPRPRRTSSPRSFWWCTCGAGNPAIVPAAAASEEADRHLRAMAGPLRVGLVACSDQKLNLRAPARQLYSSPLFRKSLRHALGGCQVVYILSAKHGLVELDQELDPYNQRLPRRKSERQAWASVCAGGLAERHPRREDLVLYMLAGQQYTVPMIQATAAWWPAAWREHIVMPLHGKEIGQRLRWLNQHALPTT